MSLTERDVIDRMQTSLREAIQASKDLAVSSRKGPTYTKLRESLSTVEGACRQLSVFRQDTRWLGIGMVMSKAHDMAGGWLRGYKHPVTGRRIHFNAQSQNPLFLMLAANLVAVFEAAELLRTQKTGKVGMILPDTPYTPRERTMVNGHRVTPGGIILPSRA